MRFHAWLHLSGFLDKPFSASGAGNGDLTLTAGNTHHLTALGAVIITMVPILQAVEKLQEFAVFLIPLVGIAGEAPEKRPEHQAVGHGRQQQIDLRIAEKHADKAGSKTGAEDHHVQYIGSIAAHHKVEEFIAKLLKKLSNHR